MQCTILHTFIYTSRSSSPELFKGGRENPNFLLLLKNYQKWYSSTDVLYKSCCIHLDSKLWICCTCTKLKKFTELNIKYIIEQTCKKKITKEQINKSTKPHIHNDIKRFCQSNVTQSATLIIIIYIFHLILVTNMLLTLEL